MRSLRLCARKGGGHSIVDLELLRSDLRQHSASISLAMSGARGCDARWTFVGVMSMTHLTCSLFTEAVSCVLWVPIDVTKERLQIQRLPQRCPRKGGDMMYRNSVDALRRLPGQGHVWLQRLPGPRCSLLARSPLYFMFYEESRQRRGAFTYASTDDMPFALHVTNSVIAGAMLPS